MTLVQWINQLGVREVAKLLNTDAGRVSMWNTKKSLPKDEMKVQIVKLTHGLVSYEEMIEDFVCPQVKKKSKK